MIQSVLQMAASTKRNPSYITTNRLGIYQFQYRIPRRFQLDPTTPKLVRKSLSTRDRKTALAAARRLIVTLDDLADKSDDQQTDFVASVMSLLKIKRCFSSEKRSHFFEQSNGVELFNNLPSRSGTGVSLTSAMDMYLTEKKKTWNPKSVEANERNLGLKIQTFIQIVGDIDCSLLRVTHVTDYKTKLFKIPVNRSKRKIYRSLTLDEIFQMDIPEKDKLSAETLLGHFNKVSAFLDWGYRNGLMDADLKMSLQKVIKKPKHAVNQRDAFSPEDLKKLFNSEQYINGTHKQASHYFIPLLALFTGARQNELCQLYKEDVYRDHETGLWVLDINDDGKEKHLKKPSHSRIVPLHPQLIELGFIDYVQKMTTKRIFTDLKFKRDGYGQSFSRWFNSTYRNANHCNVGQGRDENKNFHSFRHSFITRLTNDYEIPQHKIAHLVGHRPNDGSETIQRYTKPTELIDRYRIIELLQWESINFSAIRTFISNKGD